MQCLCKRGISTKRGLSPLEGNLNVQVNCFNAPFAEVILSKKEIKQECLYINLYRWVREGGLRWKILVKRKF